MLLPLHLLNLLEFAVPVGAISGTITPSTTEDEIRDHDAGSLTLLIEVTNDTWVASGAAFDAIRQDIIDGLVATGEIRNKLHDSDNLDNAAKWDINNATLSLSALDPPPVDGVTQAWELNTTAAVAQHRIRVDPTLYNIDYTLGEFETYTWYVRNQPGSTYDKFMFQIPADGNHQRLGFDITNKVQFGQFSGSYDGLEIEAIDADWTRFTAWFDSRNVGLLQNYVDLIVDDNTPGNSGIFAGDGTGIVIAGPMLQDGEDAFSRFVESPTTGEGTWNPEEDGWNNVVRDALDVSAVVRTSDTIVTVTIPSFILYNIDADETVEVTIPASALVTSTDPVDAGSFDIAGEVEVIRGGTSYADEIPSYRRRQLADDEIIVSIVLAIMETDDG